MQVTLTFDTDQFTASKIYRILVAAQQALDGPDKTVIETPVAPVIVDTVDDTPPKKPSHQAAGNRDKVPQQDADTIKANRVAAAAKARAAAAAKRAQAQTTQEAPEDLNGGSEDEDQDQDDMGLADPSMSPGEARDAGLALVREAYAAGHVAPVKTLQKAWGVQKFYDVPVEQGNEFYAQAMKLAQETGIRR